MGQSVGRLGGEIGRGAGAADRGGRSERRQDYLGSLLQFLKSKGVSVDAEQRQYDATKKSKNPGMTAQGPETGQGTARGCFEGQVF